MKRMFIMLVVGLLGGFTGLAMALPEVSITRTEMVPVIDGKEDDACWATIPAYNGFHTMYPDPLKPPSEKTSFKLCFDNDALYFFIKCFDHEPDKIKINKVHRDSGLMGDDAVGIMLDTYNDDYTAYLLGVNAAGVQSDAHCEENGRQDDDTWDGDWESAVSMDETGWNVEIAIPFRELRFNPKGDMTWGINLFRTVSCTNEVFSYTDLGKDVSYLKVSRSAILKGLDHNIRCGRFNIQTSGYSRVQSRFLEDGYEVTGGVSLDVKTHISSGLILDAALFPDFGELEADPNVINLSRYEYFYPERRPLFTERNDFFDTPLTLFYSRRIGAKLPDGSFVPLTGGLKLTGKEGKFSIAALNTWTGSTNYTDYFGSEERIEGATQSVVRLAADVAKSSSVGIIGTRFSDGEEVETVAGIDASINLGNEWRLTGQVAANADDGTHPAAGKVKLSNQST